MMNCNHNGGNGSGPSPPEIFAASPGACIRVYAA